MSLYSYHRDHQGGFILQPRKEWYTIQQVALILSVSSPTAWRFIRDKKLDAQRVGGRWRVPYEALQDFLVRSNERR